MLWPYIGMMLVEYVCYSCPLSPFPRSGLELRAASVLGIISINDSDGHFYNYFALITLTATSTAVVFQVSFRGSAAVCISENEGTSPLLQPS